MAALKNVFYIVCFSCLLIRETLAADGLYLQADPTTIDVGVTKELKVNCSFIPAEQTVVQKATKLVIYGRRPGLDLEYKEVASVNVSARNVIDQVTLIDRNVVASVHISDTSGTGPSILELEWDDPSESEIREYKCLVLGEDGKGQTKGITATVSINLANKTSATVITPILTSATPISTTHIPVTQTPGIQSPTAQTPATMTPTAQTPATMTPTAQTPATMTSTAQTPATMTPTAQTPATMAPTAQTPATMIPTAQTPATMTPTAQTPATMAPTAQTPTTQTPTTTMPTTKKPKSPFSCGKCNYRIPHFEFW